jgi:predicted nucleotidyltransferase
LNKILKQIIRAEKDTLDELVVTLRRHLKDDKIISAVLFGSVAVKKEGQDSDIDLLIVSNDFASATATVSKAQEAVSSIFNGRLSPLIMNERELVAKKKGPLVHSIVANHKAVAGKSLREIIAGK